jgi:O-antigen/teichoic acid export membrane protein
MSTGFAARVVSALVAIVTTPIIVRYLGNEGYGLFTTISSVVAWLHLSNFGIGLGLQNALTEATARDDQEAQNSLISTAFFALSAIGAALALVGFAVFQWINWVEVFPPSTPRYVHEIPGTVLIVFFGFLTHFVLSCVGPIYAARQELHLLNGFNLVSHFASLTGLLAAVHFDLGLAGVAAASIGASAAMNWGFTGYYLYLRGPRQLRPRIGSITRQAWVKIYKTSLAFFVIQICAVALFQTDVMIIAHFVSAESVTPYAVAQKLFIQVAAVFALVLGPMWAAYAHARATGDLAWIRRVHGRIVRWFFVIYGVLLFGVALFGTRFFQLWVGESAAPNAALLMGVAAYFCLRQWTDLYAVLINGLDFITPQAISASIHTVITITLNLILVSRFGVYGIVAGSCIGYLLVSAWYLPLLARRALRSLQSEAAIAQAGKDVCPSLT